MKTTKMHTRIISVILAVIMLFSVATVSAFADDYTFAYHFADDEGKTIYVTAFRGEIPSDGYVVIPDEIEGYTVVGIAEHTFDNHKELRGIIIPQSVVFIDEDAFYGCEGIIDVQVKNMDEIDVDDGVFNTTEWYEAHKQDYVISGTTLVSYKGSDEIVTVPYNCTTIADGAFKNNKTIKTVYIEKDIKVIGESAFEGCTALENVIVGAGAGDVKIGKNAFAGTPWLINFPGPFVTIGTTLVKYIGNAEYVAIPNVLTSIADDAFSTGEKPNGISFKVKVPVSIKNFGENCFYLYTSATPVFPKLVVYAGSAAEEYCTANNLHYTNAPMPGDANLDGKVTVADARYVVRLSAKLESPVIEPEVKEAIDITCDGKISLDDARCILRIAVKLDTYSLDELLSMPRTDYETLMTAANALAIAKAYGCAYSKLAYGEISKYDMNLNTRTYLNMFKKELTPAKKAQTVTYNQDTPEALANLFDITLIDSTMIKDYYCYIKDGKYIIKIVLKDETVDGRDLDRISKTERMFPVDTVSHFTKAMEKKYWNKCEGVDYTLTYKDCTLEMAVNIKTMMITELTVNMGYDFEITGSIMGIGVHGSKGKAATATRHDTIKYTNFVYFDR